MKIKDLPIEIQEVTKKRWYEYRPADKFDNDSPLSSAFAYGKTIEGHQFWYDISNGKYDHFYERYPRQKTKVNNYIKSGNKTIYYATIKNKKARIIIEYLEDEEKNI